MAYQSHEARISHVIFVAIIVAMVAAMGIVSASIGPAIQAPSSPSTSFSSQASSTGLQLRMRLNASTIPQGGIVSAQIDLVNTLSTSVSLDANFSANPNLAAWNGDNSECGGSSVDHVFDYALYRGHVTAANISQAGLPLLLHPPEPELCLTYVHPEDYVKQVEFPPYSDVATLSANASESDVFPTTQVEMLTNAVTEACEPSSDYTSSGPGPNGSSYSGIGFGLSCHNPGAALYGYWPIRTMGECPSGPSQVAFDICAEGLDYVFQPFRAGSYTVVAEDMWHEAAYAYFQATPTPSPVEVLSATSPIPPYNPAGPTVSLALKNVGNMTITSLTATLPGSIGWLAPYSFTFNVSTSNPVFPSQTVRDRVTMFDTGISDGVTYPLMINGTLVGDAAFTRFSYTVQVQFEPPG